MSHHSFDLEAFFTLSPKNLDRNEEGDLLKQVENRLKKIISAILEYSPILMGA